MANLSELKGELLALRCYLAALLQVLPARSHPGVAHAVKRNAALLRDQLDTAGTDAFERTLTSLAARARVA